jgi:hypothetical protein
MRRSIEPPLAKFWDYYATIAARGCDWRPSHLVCLQSHGGRRLALAVAGFPSRWRLAAGCGCHMMDQIDYLCGPLMSGERIREGDQALPSSITVGTGQTGTVQQ